MEVRHFAIRTNLFALAVLTMAASCDLFTSNETARWAQPTVSGDLVVFSEGDGTISARSQQSGELRWTTRVDTAGALGMTMPVVGCVIVVPVARYTVGLDVNTGHERWRCEAPLDRRENAQSPRPGVVAANTVGTDGNLVFVPAWGASVSALDAVGGRVQWIWSPGDSIPFRSGAEGVAVSGDSVYATVWHNVNPLGGSSEAWLVALDRATGRELWRKAFPPYTGGSVTVGGPVIFGDLVIFGTIGGYEFAVKRFSQQLAWSFPAAPQQATMAQTELFDDVVYHDGGDRNLYALRARDGSLVWKSAVHN